MPKPTMYRARFQSTKQDFRTRYYATPERAQDALMQKVGSFVCLGYVSGDVFSCGVEGNMRCWAAPRNGGQVSLEVR